MSLRRSISNSKTVHCKRRSEKPFLIVNLFHLFQLCKCNISFAEHRFPTLSINQGIIESSLSITGKSPWKTTDAQNLYADTHSSRTGRWSSRTRVTTGWRSIVECIDQHAIHLVTFDGSKSWRRKFDRSSFINGQKSRFFYFLANRSVFDIDGLVIRRRSVVFTEDGEFLSEENHSLFNLRQVRREKTMANVLNSSNVRHRWEQDRWERVALGTVHWPDSDSRVASSSRFRRDKSRESCRIRRLRCVHCISLSLCTLVF